RPDIKPLEVRLFAVEPAERSGPVAAGLVWSVYLFARDESYTHLFISGVTGQLPLYEHIGFEPLGPPVGDGAAAFVPMWLAVARDEQTMGRGIELCRKRLARANANQSPVTAAPGLSDGNGEPVCLLPGPVAIAPAVRAAFHGPLIYHRADEFLALFERVRSRLADLVGGKKVAVQVGSGTLANDMVAATLAADPRRGNGLVLVNGEFGERLVRQARRMGLAPRTLAWDWGRPWD